MSWRCGGTMPTDRSATRWSSSGRSSASWAITTGSSWCAWSAVSQSSRDRHAAGSRSRRPRVLRRSERQHPDGGRVNNILIYSDALFDAKVGGKVWLVDGLVPEVGITLIQGNPG